MLFYLFETLRRQGRFESRETVEPSPSVGSLVEASLKLLIDKINELFPDAYPGNVFKNQDRQSELLIAMTE